MATTRKVFIRMPGSLRDAAAALVEPFGGSVSGLVRARLQSFAERVDGGPGVVPTLEELGLPESDSVIVTSRVDVDLLSTVEERIGPYGGDVKEVVRDEFARFVREERVAQADS